MEMMMVVPPAPPGMDMKDAWFCYEVRIGVEDRISPWFADGLEVFDWAERTFGDKEEFLIKRKFIRTSDGVFECDGLDGITPLEPVNVDAGCAPTGLEAAEDAWLSKNSA
mgnify:FL=1